MRRLLLSVVAWAASFHCAWTQTPAPAANTATLPQIPFGQTYKDFQFPLYQNGALNATLSAVSAKGITINRAETTDLKIDLYTNGKVTTTITSPLADLYVADRKMRTKNTVLVERADLEATAQTCDFDLLSKKYLLRQNVHVLLKHFDAGSSTKASPAPAAGPAPADETAPIAPLPMAPRPGESLLDTPGASAATNPAPIQPSPPATP